MLSSEENTFAPLFEPPTPRASPTPLFSQPTLSARHPSRVVSHPNGHIVQATDDPLSTNLGSAAAESSIHFFDTFTQNAKHRSSAARTQVLDELLLHQDDPMWFVLDNDSSPTTDLPDTSLLSDLDHDYFRPSPVRSFPSSSSSIPPPVVAPPVASHLTASPPPSRFAEFDPPLDRGRAPQMARSSSELMSKLLRNAQSFPPSSNSVPTSKSDQETLYDSATRSPSTQSMLEGRPSHFSTSKQRIPFAPATVTHSTSPFSASVFNPPSGAPGFRGDKYDWDKGFSNELDSEMKENSDNLQRSRGWGTTFGFGSFSTKSNLVMANANESSNREGGRPLQRTRSDGPDGEDRDSGLNRLERQNMSTSHGDSAMGDIIEKKVGMVELVGRRASSDSVLTPELASMLRVHLPALSRLPHSWTLIYSLDQHGISLNTLYSRCEAHLTQKVPLSDLGIVSRGMLLVIKDDVVEGEEQNRAIFGAWIAEGMRLNKGRGPAYSGGGESFLWKYVDGVLQVFKTTGKNNYVALCESDCISFGGGDGHYGLYLDDTLFEGSSAPCPTFDNEPLCTAGRGRDGSNLRTVKFECIGLEVWGMA